MDERREFGFKANEVLLGAISAVNTGRRRRWRKGGGVGWGLRKMRGRRVTLDCGAIIVLEYEGVAFRHIVCVAVVTPMLVTTVGHGKLIGIY